LSFLAQINLRDFPESIEGLPEEGLLSFFYDAEEQPSGYDPKDGDRWLVEYVDPRRGELSPVSPPGELRTEFQFKKCAVAFEPEVTLPDWASLRSMTDVDLDAYLYLQEQLIGSSGAMHHRLMGHHQVVQNPMELECQLASNGVYCGNPASYLNPRVETLRPGADDWRLLLQLDSDDELVGWMWGDVGRLYFWIRSEDLRDLRFDRTWLCLQCH